MHCCRFSVKVTALWEEGSNADVALDDIAVGAACFNRGKLLALGHHRFLEEKNNISIQFRYKNAHLSDAQMKDEIKKKKKIQVIMCSKTLVVFLVNSITFVRYNLSDCT